MNATDTGSNSQGAGSPCARLIPLFNVLGDFKATEAELCTLAQEYSHIYRLVRLCWNRPHDDALDRYALCALFCCCLNESTVERNQENCVNPVLEASGKGYYKVNTYYDQDGKIIRDDGHIGPRGSRSPDVVVVKDPSLPAEGSNIQKVYEMKFGSKDYSRYTNGIGPDGKTQKQAYDDLFGKKIDDAPLSDVGENQCKCDDKDDGEKAKQEARDWLNKAYDAIDKINTPWYVPPPVDGRNQGGQGGAFPWGVPTPWWAY